MHRPQQSPIRTSDTHLYRKPNGIYHYRFNIRDNGTYRSVRLSMYSRCPYEAGALAGLVTYQTWKSKIMESGLPYSEIRERLISLFREILAEHKAGIDKDGLLSCKQQEAYKNTASFGADPVIHPELTQQIAERIGLPEPTNQERQFIDQDKPALLQGLTDSVLAYNQSLRQPYTDTPTISTTAIAETAPAPMKLVSEVFIEFSKDRLAANTISEKSLAYYKGGLNKFIAAVGDQPINEIDKTSMRRFRDSLTGSDSTKNKRLMGMSAIFTWAITNDYNINNPFTGSKITIAAHEQGQRDAFTKQEAQLIFQHLANPVNKRFKDHHKLISKMLAYSGARLGEIAQLYCNDIKEKDGIWFMVINADQPDKSVKNANAVRSIPLHKSIVNQVLIRKNKLNTDRLFPELTNPTVGYGARYSAWFATNVKKRLNLRDETTLHSFRHTVATQLQQADVPETITAQLLGHSRGETLSYTHYGKGSLLTKLKAAIDLITYEQPPVAPSRD